MKSLFPILLVMSLSTLTFANNVLPVANITSSSGSFSAKIGQTFTFSGATSYDPDGGGINYYWWYVDGVQIKAGSTASSFTYDPGIVGNGSTNRTFQLMLKVRDNEYSTKTKTVTVTILADKRNYFVTDHLGNVRATVDQNGAVIGYDDFYPYGQVMPGRSSNTANANDIYKFTGHERDAELGLDYMLARNYDPEIGRFLSVDPLYNKYPALSPYMYVAGNPLINIDPDGKQIRPPNTGLSSVSNTMIWAKAILGDPQAIASVKTQLAVATTGLGLGLSPVATLAGIAFESYDQGGFSMASSGRTAYSSVLTSLPFTKNLVGMTKIVYNISAGVSGEVLGGMQERFLLGNVVFNKDAIAVDFLGSLWSRVMGEGLSMGTFDTIIDGNLVSTPTLSNRTVEFMEGVVNSILSSGMSQGATESETKSKESMAKHKERVESGKEK